MKILIALLILLLAGCSHETPQTDPTSAPTTVPVTTGSAETTEPTEPGLYIPGSYLEAETDGTVRAYDLNGMGVMSLRFLESDLLVTGSTGMDTQIMLLSGERCVTRSYMNAGAYMYLAGGALQTGGEEIAYYDDNANCVVLLTAALKETARIPIPESLPDAPVISSDLKHVYYVTTDGIRVMDLTTGISRMLRQQTGARMTLTGILLSDRLLQVYISEDVGKSCYAFISTETGELIGQDSRLRRVDASEDFYVLQRADGYLDEVLFGKPGEEPACFRQNRNATLHAQPDVKALCSEERANGQLKLDWYDLVTGRRTASVNLPGHLNISCVTAAPEGTFVWIAAYDLSNDTQVLLRWDRGLSGVTDDLSYTTPRYTLAAPDYDGIALQQARADALGAAYGVRINLGLDVRQPEDYVLTPEHRVDAYVYALDVLERCLQAYPEGFLKQAAAVTNSGVLEIALVRDISYDRMGVQYWLDMDAFVAVEIGILMEQTVYHEICHLLDSTIIANSYAYDDWEELNPKGVWYDYNYQDYTYHGVDACFVNGERVFIDTYSLTYPKEDRARIMEFAMMPECGDFFESETMQRKLYQICIGIRQCFGLEKSRETFLWEQYLKESLAYNK